MHRHGPTIRPIPARSEFSWGEAVRVPWIAGAVLLTAPMLVPTSVSAQSPTPELVPAADAGCFVRKIWDVSSVEGADAANWELRYSPAPSPTTNVEAAEIVDSREGRQIARNIRNDLRDFRPVLDGSRWFFRVVAASGTEPIGEWSAPAVYDAAYSPDGMYQASASDLSLTLTWALTNDLGNCADRVHYEVRKDSPGGSPIRSETVSGASGSRTVDVSATGAGTYYVRLAAFYGSDQPEDAVGRVGDDVPVEVAPAPVATPEPGEPVLADEPERPALRATPAPTVEPDDPCPAVVNLGWDVRSIPNARGIRWEIARQPFTVAGGYDPNSIDGSEARGRVGSVPVDLRDYGPVLDGSSYYFRVVAGGVIDGQSGDVALPSETVVFTMNHVLPDGGYRVFPYRMFGTIPTVRIQWSALPGKIAACADFVQIEMKQGSDFTTSTFPDPASSVVREYDLDRDQQDFTLDYEPADYWVRLQARSSAGPYTARLRGRSPIGPHTVGGVGSSVHIRSPPSAVEVATPAPTLEPGADCPAYTDYSWDVRAIAGPEFGATDRIRMELVRIPDPSGPFVWPDRPPDRRWTVQDLAGRDRTDLRSLGSTLDGTLYALRAIAHDGLGAVALPSEPSLLSWDVPLQGVYNDVTAEQAGGRWEIVLSWAGMPQEITRCADRIRPEVQAPNSTVWIQQPVVDARPSGTVRVAVTTGPGSYRVRLVPVFSQVEGPAAPIGRPGNGVQVWVGLVEPTEELPAAVALVDHVVTDELVALLDHAETRGYASVVTGGAGCRMGSSALRGVVKPAFLALGGSPTTCLFRLLEGPPLVEPWRIATAATARADSWTTGSSCTVSTSPLQIEVIHPGGPTPATGCYLDALTLRGSTGADWHDAFE